MPVLLSFLLVVSLVLLGLLQLLLMAELGDIGRKIDHVLRALEQED